MKFIDLLLMSLGNLSRRKMRTVLTILGVLIGTTSVVTMISLGIGLNELTFESIDKIYRGLSYEYIWYGWSTAVQGCVYKG